MAPSELQWDSETGCGLGSGRVACVGKQGGGGMLVFFAAVVRFLYLFSVFVSLKVWFGMRKRFLFFFRGIYILMRKTRKRERDAQLYYISRLGR